MNNYELQLFFSALKKNNDTDVYIAFKNHVDGLLKHKKYRQAFDIIFEFAECFDQESKCDFSKYIFHTIVR